MTHNSSETALPRFGGKEKKLGELLLSCIEVTGLSRRIYGGKRKSEPARGERVEGLCLAVDVPGTW